MIDLYYWPTPNGWKVAIMLEECGLEYETIPVNIGRGEQFEPSFLKISPNNRMPAIVDRDGPEGEIAIFESGAILCYLAEKAGRFMPRSADGGVNARYSVMQWLFWQVGGLGPMAGQLGHFANYAEERIPYAIERYRNEYDRLLGVMDRRLAEAEYLGGEYSIADMASYPWVLPYKRYELDLDAFPNVRRWFDAVKARPAVQRGVALGEDWRKQGELDEEARRVLFGQTAASTAGSAQGRAGRQS